MVSCKSQQEESYLDRDFVFTVEFYPSFTVPCKIVFQNEGGRKVLSIDTFYDKRRLEYVNDTVRLKPEKTEVLLIDKWFKEYYGDTVYVSHMEKVEVSNKEFQRFVDSVFPINLTKQKSLEKGVILDGITIYLKFENDSVNNCFSLRCPDPEDSVEFTIIKTMFDLMENNFKLESTNNYIETLKGYFDFGLCVKHISDDPLEYRFYSHLSSTEAFEFYGLMKSLPRNKPVIFDFSNLGGMGTMFYDDFAKYVKENPDVYWIMGEYFEEFAKEVGVPQNRIFNTREDGIKAIKKKEY